MKTNNQKGFTLIEILIYIAILAMIVSVTSSFLNWSIKSNTKAKAMRETLDNTRRVVEIMSHEIKEAKSIYIPTSVFDSHPGQLSLETLHYLPAAEETSYIDFYLCETYLCFKKEGQNSIILTSDRVEVNNLEFTQIGNSLQIHLKIDYKNPYNRPEYRASVNITSTVLLRNY